MTTEVYHKWVTVFGEDNLLVVNFDDLTRRTSKVLDKISLLFELPPQRAKSIPGNKKENSLKIRIDDERRGILSSVLGDEVVKFHQLFDSHKDRV